MKNVMNLLKHFQNLLNLQYIAKMISFFPLKDKKSLEKKSSRNISLSKYVVKRAQANQTRLLARPVYRKYIYTE